MCVCVCVINKVVKNYEFRELSMIYDTKAKSLVRFNESTRLELNAQSKSDFYVLQCCGNLLQCSMRKLYIESCWSNWRG